MSDNAPHGHPDALAIRTDDGEKLKLMMTRGGTKVLGGDVQRDGIAALVQLLAQGRS